MIDPQDTQGVGVPPQAGSGHSRAEPEEVSVVPTSVPNAARHPGKTPVQRRVLDEIGCGNHSPIMAKATREKLLRDGLIVELGSEVRPFIGSITFRIRSFEMPIPVHMRWCAAMSDEAERTGT